MNYAAFKKELTLTDLTRRLYNIKGPRSAELTKHAQAALLRANPHLQDLTKVPEGTLIAVPNAPGVQPVATGPMSAVGAQIAAQLGQALAAAKSVIQRSLAEENEAADTIANIVRSSDFRGLTKEQPDLKNRISKIAADAKAQLKSAEALRAFQTNSLKELDLILSQLFK
jgi:hypothetical protein